MAELGSILNAAVESKQVPQVVVYATNGDGSFTYKHAAGKVSADDDAAPVREDAVFLLASQSKLVTSLAALQVIEKGLIGLDDDVAKHLPELAQQPILTGFNDDGSPVLRERRNAITLRQLLTHTAGTAYDAANESLIRFQQHQGRTPGVGTDVVSKFSYPLLFEPGESWSYGASIDWAGLLVERLTNSTLEEYMKKNMWEPLGITTMTFFPDQHPDLKARIPVLSMRTPDGGLARYPGPSINENLTGCLGGQGLYTTMEDYIKIMRSVLANDGKLLRPNNVDDIFKPQLGSATAAALKEFKQTPVGQMFIGEFVPKIELDYGLGGLLFMQDDEGRRKKFTMCWGGMTNLFWTIDREAGLALTFGTQLFPPGDKACAQIITAVEKGVYKMAGVA